jgi:CRP-like cAMP-binding protein
MSTESSELRASLDSELIRDPGETFWSEGEKDAQPLLIQKGVVAYRRGNVAIGFLGPGQVALPVPGVAGGGAAAAELVAITETTAKVLEPDAKQLSDKELGDSSVAVITGADRLGNMSLPQRLAALLLDITEMTGQPIVGCRQDILAMAAAARRETVATILSGWRDEDWIQTRYRRCKVMDREALVRIRDKGN